MDIQTPATQVALARYREVLSRRFGIDADSIVKVPGGWSAKAYEVRTGERRFFLKVYDRTQASVLPWAERIDGYIHVLAYLAGTRALRGLTAAPLNMTGGGYKAQQGDEVFLLYDFIKGDTPGYGKMSRAQKCELAGILARLHSLGTQLPLDLGGLHEDITLWFCDDLRAFLEADAPDEPTRALRPYKDTLMIAINRTVKLRDRVRAPAVNLSLCHTDAHGGNVIQGEGLVLVDWEGLSIAPPEADLFMYADDPDWDAFLEAYCAARPGFVLDEEMLSFYQLRRVVEDIWYYLLRLLNEDPDAAERAEIYAHMGRIGKITEGLVNPGCA